MGAHPENGRAHSVAPGARCRDYDRHSRSTTDTGRADSNYRERPRRFTGNELRMRVKRLFVRRCDGPPSPLEIAKHPYLDHRERQVEILPVWGELEVAK